MSLRLLYHLNSKKDFRPYIELFNIKIQLNIENNYSKKIYGLIFFKDKIEIKTGLKTKIFELPWKYKWYKTEVKLKDNTWLNVKSRKDLYDSNWNNYYNEKHDYKYKNIKTKVTVIIIKRIFKMKHFKKFKETYDIEVKFRRKMGINKIIGSSYKLIDNNIKKSLKEIKKIKNF